MFIETSAKVGYNVSIKKQGVIVVTCIHCPWWYRSSHSSGKLVMHYQEWTMAWLKNKRNKVSDLLIFNTLIMHKDIDLDL